MNNKNSSIIIVLLVILIALVAYLVFRPKTGIAPAPTIPAPIVPAPAISDVKPIKQTVPSNNPQAANPNLVANTTWGMSFEKPSGWNVAENNASIVSVTDGDDTIKAEFVSGNSITDGDAKFGPIAYSYSNTQNAWMVEMPDEQGVGMHTLPAVVATPVAYTPGGLPIFNGTGRWKTYIVPLTHTTFLKFNITGGGNTQPLTALLQTLQSI